MLLMHSGYTKADVLCVLDKNGMQIKNVLIATSDETGTYIYSGQKAAIKRTGNPSENG